ncbi:unnamed protein product [Gordionus sp. m RMFG-2023]
MKNGDFNEQIENLSIIINQLDKKLHEKIGDHYHVLLSQALKINDIEKDFEKIKQRVYALKELNDKVKSKIYEPYKSIQLYTKQLTNIQATCDLLRSYSRYSSLYKKLQQIMNENTKEIIKAAYNIKELDLLLNNTPNLVGIDDINLQVFEVEKYKKEIILKAYDLLMHGLDNQNQVQTSTALQVYHQLGQFHSLIEQDIMDKIFCGDFKVALSECFGMKGNQSENNINDYKKFNENGNFSKTESQSEIKGLFWLRWDRLLNEILYKTLLKASHLQIVLSKKKSVLVDKSRAKNNEQHMETLYYLKNFYEKRRVNEHELIEAFLTKLEAIMKEEIESKAANFGSRKIGPSHQTFALFKQICEWEYPKLLRYVTDTRNRILNSNPITNLCKGDSSQNYSDDSEQDMPDILDDVTYLTTYNHSNSRNNETTKILNGNNKYSTACNANNNGLRLKIVNLFQEVLSEAFSKGYLSKCLSRLFDPINVLFSSATHCFPNVSDVENLIKVMTNELTIVRFDQNLSLNVAKNINKALRLVLVKCEQMIDNSSAAYKVTTQPNNIQKNNANIGVLLYHLRYFAETRLVPLMKDINDEASIETSSIYLDCLRIIVKELPDLLINSVLKPYFSAVETTLEDILLTMHREDFVSTTPSDSQNSTFLLSPPSPYMKEFIDFAKTFKRNVLNTLFGNFDFGLNTFVSTQYPTISNAQHSSFEESDIDIEVEYYAHTKESESKANPFYSLVLKLFITHTLLPTIRNALYQMCLIRPLSDDGKRKMISDSAHFQSVFGSIFLPTHYQNKNKEYKVKRGVEFIKLDNEIDNVYERLLVWGENGPSLVQEDNLSNTFEVKIEIKPDILSAYEWFTCEILILIGDNTNFTTNPVSIYPFLAKKIDTISTCFGQHSSLAYYKCVFDYLIPLSHHIFSFFDSRKGEEFTVIINSLLSSPYLKLNFSGPAEYWRIWLKPKISIQLLSEICATNKSNKAASDDDKTSAKKAIEMIRDLHQSCFNDYSMSIIKEKRKSFHPAYPLATKILEALSVS